MKIPVLFSFQTFLIAIVFSGCPEPTVIKYDTSLIGYWKSGYGDGFEIKKTDLTSDPYIFYQYNNSEKSVSFAGYLANTIDFDASSGYIIVRIINSGTWNKTLDGYYSIHWQNLIMNTVQESCAYKTGGFNTMPTLANAEDEFTIQNGYYVLHGDYEKQ